MRLSRKLHATNIHTHICVCACIKLREKISYIVSWTCWVLINVSQFTNLFLSSSSSFMWTISSHLVPLNCPFSPDGCLSLFFKPLAWGRTLWCSSYSWLFWNFLKRLSSGSKFNQSHFGHDFVSTMMYVSNHRMSFLYFYINMIPFVYLFLRGFTFAYVMGSGIFWSLPHAGISSFFVPPDASSAWLSTPLTLLDTVLVGRSGWEPDYTTSIHPVVQSKNLGIRRDPLSFLFYIYFKYPVSTSRIYQNPYTLSILMTIIIVQVLSPFAWMTDITS